MDLQNIQDQLNTEFAKSETRIIFWFDDKGEYEDEVSELQLVMIKVNTRMRYRNCSLVMQSCTFLMVQTGSIQSIY